jgi:predicted DNA-binding ribbon-helix-helix protein
MECPVINHSIVFAGRKTNVSLEEPFWRGLRDIAASRRITLSVLVAGINAERECSNLSSALRLFVLKYYQTLVALPDDFVIPTKQHRAAH